MGPTFKISLRWRDKKGMTGKTRPVDAFDTILRTREELEHHLRFIEMRNPPFPTYLRLGKHIGKYDSNLIVELLVRDRRVGAMITVRMEFENAFSLPMSEPEFISRTMLHVANAYMHEACESFHYAGVRVFDPHPASTERFDNPISIDVRLALPINITFQTVPKEKTADVLRR